MQRLALWSLSSVVAFALAACAASRAAGSEPEDALSTERAPPTPVDESAEALARLQATLEAGHREAAREFLRDLLAGLPDPVPGREAAQLAFLPELDPFVEELGMLDASLDLWERMLALRERILPAEDDEVLRARGNLAVTKFALGDLAGASAGFEAMLAVWSRSRPADDLELLTVQQNLAAIRMDTGDLAGARALFESVLATRLRLLPAEDVDVLKARQNLAAALYHLGDLDRAHELNEDVFEVRSRLLPADHPELLAAQVNLAATRKARGDLDGARELEEAVLEARTRRLPAGHPDLLRTMLNVAATRGKLGDLAGAGELEAAVLEERLRFLPADHLDLLDGMQNLALTRYESGDLAGTRELVASLLERMRSRARTMRAEAARPARERARAELQRYFEMLFLASAVDPARELEPAFFATLECLRLASVADAASARAAAERPELGSVLATLRAQLNDLVAAGPADDADVEAWREAVLVLAEERDRTERELRQTLVEAGAFVGDLDEASVAARLAPGSVAASFLRHPRMFEKDPETGIVPPRVDSLLAFRVVPDQPIRRIDLGPAAEVEALVADWRAALGRPILDRGIGPAGTASQEASVDEIGRRLRERVLDPLLEDLAGVHTLHVELDDVLHLVPLDALPLDQGLVGDRVAIRSEISLARLVHPDPLVAEGGGLTLAGGVDYDADPAESARDADAPRFEAAAERSGSDGPAFGFLAGTAVESASIAELHAGISDRRATLLAGGSATKAALAALAPDTRYLHVATHGWFASERFASQLDALAEAAPDGGLRRAQETLTGFAPETLCGLALAGANRGPDAQGRVPGILTAEELASFDLRRCELAVLSACETNVGLRRAGQGIRSLQSALHSAGARSAITSLWKVDDAATRRLFELFYTQLWKEGLGKHEALWRAKKTLRAEGHPVRDWAGWVLSGEPE